MAVPASTAVDPAADSDTRHPTWLDRWPITVRLFAISLVGLVALVSVGVVSLWVIRANRSAMADVALLSRATMRVQEADMRHDAIQSRTFALMLDAVNSEARRTQLDAELEGYRRTLVDTLSMPIPDPLRQAVHELDPEIANYVYQAQNIERLQVDGTASMRAAMPLLEAAFTRLADRHDRLNRRFGDAVASAERTAAVKARSGLWAIAFACIAAAFVVTLVGREVARSVPRALDRVRDAALAIADGDLSIRTHMPVNDEVGAVAGAVNRMADTLQTMITRLQSEQDRDAFSRQLSEVLEMADTEADTYDVVARAMSSVSPDMAMELLVSDSSRAHLERATAHPSAGGACCTVESPYGCMAVRRGNPIVFESSDTLNACSKLHGRAGGVVSAVCVPLTFMGRSLGVLHATSTTTVAPAPRIVSQLTTLGILTGNRIGTVRAFERTQVQANTDMLTGLLNRRSVEARVRRFAQGSGYAVLLADLDHFKKLNDTHGHDAGDRALKTFADVMRRSLREMDLAARWGGEEFMAVLEGHTALSAFEVAERIRRNLETACQIDGPVFSASFGVADSSMAASFDQLVRVADDALYQSKEGGRNRVTVGDALRLNGTVPRRDAEHLASIALNDLHDQDHA